MYIYKSYRYFVPQEEKHKNLTDAIESARLDHEYGTTDPLEIIKNEKVILNHDQLLEKFWTKRRWE